MDMEILQSAPEGHAYDPHSIQDESLTSRDDNYYLADGDCVIRVENVLFKVHRCLLTRDSSAFADMFSMPQENSSPSVHLTDDNPLRLYDEVDSFRALCWMLYALPMVHMDLTDKSLKSIDTVSKIASLFLIAHKYHFENHETYARKVLLTQCASVLEYPSRLHMYFITCSESRLESLLRASCLTEDTATPDEFSLTFALQNTWLNRLRHHQSSISYPLGVAETLGLRTFMGQLYYYQLCKTIRKQTSIPGSTAFSHPPSDLTINQQLALYRGSLSLRRYWDGYAHDPPKTFDCPPDENHDCNKIWPQIHVRQIASTGGLPFHPVKFLTTTLSTLKHGGLERVNIDCLVPYMDDMIKTLQASLSDHFLGPIPGALPVS